MSAANGDNLQRFVRQHPLATVTGLGLVIGFLLRDGAMCPKCGHGTRTTSKRWARCKKCGERVQRMPNNSITEQ